jgi:hypothetical protein
MTEDLKKSICLTFILADFYNSIISIQFVFGVCLQQVACNKQTLVKMYDTKIH